MKKIYYAFIFLMLSFSYGCGEKDNIFINGQVDGGSRKMIYLDYLKINKTETIDSLRIKKDGTFSFSLHAEHPGIYILRNNIGEIINLLPSPGEELSITASYQNFNENYTVSGSPESEYLRQLVSKLQDTRERLNKLDNAYSTLSNVTEDQASEYINRRKAIIKDQRDYSIQFIIEHLNSIASIYAIYQEISEGQYVLGENRDIQYMKIVADSVSKAYPEVDFVQSFVTDARNAEQKFYNLKGLSSRLKEADIGLPDLAIPNPQGDTIRLSSLKGEVTLVYFWSAMSKECRNLNPQLREIYEKNKSKGFEVYAIALDNSKDLWRRAIEFDELNWINVSELSFPDSEAANIFNVRVLPSNFLLNREGEVVARDIYGPELQKWLDNML
jgi:peroxiredoxin